MRSSVLIAGYYGFGNTGDEAIMAAILNDLLALDPAIVPVVVSGNAAETTARHGVEAIGWTDLAGIVRAAEASDLIILGGGGLFHDYWGMDPFAILTPAHTGISFYAGFPLLATLLDRRLMLYGVGVGPLLSESGRLATRTACEQAHVVTVRDAESKAILEMTGVDPGLVQVTADPAFGMPAASGDRAQQILAVEEVPVARRPLIGVALRNWNVEVDPAHWERQVALALDQFCDEREGSVLFLPFQDLNGELLDDFAVAERVRHEMRNANRCVTARGRYSAPDKAALLGACDLILGMRMHALIFAIKSATPVVALAYDPKVRNVMVQAECNEYVLDLPAMTAQNLADRLAQAWQRRDSLGARLAARAGPLAAAARANARLAVDLLHRGAVPKRTLAAGTIEALKTVTLESIRSLSALRASAAAQERTAAVLATPLVEHEQVGQRLRTQGEESAQGAQALGAQTPEQEPALSVLRAQRQPGEAGVQAVLAELSESQARAEAVRGELSETRQALIASTAQLEALSHRVQALLELTAGRQRQLDERDQGLADLREQQAAKEQIIRSLTGVVAEQSRLLAERAAELERAHGALQDVVADRDRGIDWLRSEVGCALRVIADRDRGIDWLRSEHDQVTGELRRLRTSSLVRLGHGFGNAQALLRRMIGSLRHPLDSLESRPAYWKLRTSARNSIRGKLPAPAKRIVKAMLRMPSGDPPAGLVPAAVPPAAFAARCAPESVPAEFYRSLCIMPGLDPEIVSEIIARPASDIPLRRADVICFSIIDWEFRYQRPQQMMSQFAARGHRVFYLSPSRFLAANSSPLFSTRLIKENVHEVTLAVESMPNVYGEVFEAGKRSSLLAALDALRQAFGIDEAVGYVMIASWASVALDTQQRWGWRVLYDCMDEWENFPGIKPAILDAERRLVREADLLVVTAQRLWNKWEGERRLMVLARNAVDYDFYAERCGPNTLLEGIRHPLVGYYGAIADWFDVELVAHVARQRPVYTFVLLGGVFNIDVSALKALPNVRLLGQQPYETMPQYLYHFDACIIPFKVNPITEATDPVKLYEYLAGGKPVVSVPLPELAPYRESVYLAQGRDDFAARLDAALAEDNPERAADRRSIARQHTWAARYRIIEHGLAEATPRASIIVVSYQNLAVTKVCLESVLCNTDYPDYEVIVVDNASADGTADHLRGLAARHDNLQVILNDENLGFAKANNQGIARSTGEYIVLLNNDTIVPPGWLTPLLRHLADPQVGMVGPVTNFVGNEARIEVPYRTWAEMEAFAGEYTSSRAGQVADVHMLAMFCVALRRDTYADIGPLDEQFGVGMFEDDDYSQRMKQQGYRIICAADAFVHHFGQAAFKDLIRRGEYDDLFRENRQRYEKKWKVRWVLHKHAQLAFEIHFPTGGVRQPRRPARSLKATTGGDAGPG